MLYNRLRAAIDYCRRVSEKPVGLVTRISLVLTSLLVCFVVSTTGCAENVDPTDPEGAYNLYVKAFWAGDPDGVWTRLSPSTHEYFEEQYEKLVEMDETIERYLPATDHRIAREQAGSILTSEVKDGKGLFLKVFQPKEMELSEAHRVGATVEEIKINEDETAAELKTLGGDTYYLMRGERDAWFVMLIRSSSAVGKQMNWLESNQSALKQTVEDLIAEEREEREAVIAELMKINSDDDGSDDGREEDPGNNGD